MRYRLAPLEFTLFLLLTPPHLREGVNLLLNTLCGLILHRLQHPFGGIGFFGSYRDH